jgi:hypothetical protein
MSISRRLPLSNALRKRFGFVTPVTFQELEARGLFRWSEEFRHADLSQPGDHFLWFNDMEWFQPAQLLAFEFQEYHKEGFIPFAEAANSDCWCWYPVMEKNGEIPVLLCPHDCTHADLYAPSFAAAMFRHAVEYAAEPLLPEEDQKERSAMLKRFAVELAPIWPDSWRSRIENLAITPMDWSQYDPIIAEEFGSEYVEHFQVEWMKSE